MKRYLLSEQSYIASTLLAAGSIVTEAELNGAEPGQFLIEVGDDGKPIKKADRELSLPIAEDIQIAPVAPHAPNPTAAQGLPAHGTDEVMPAGNFVGAEGVESNAAAAARAKQAAAKK